MWIVEDYFVVFVVNCGCMYVYGYGMFGLWFECDGVGWRVLEKGFVGECVELCVVLIVSVCVDDEYFFVGMDVF